MNILPKKSWHVRSKKNIERVRRDEAEAAEKEKETQRRIALAESEARTEALRARSRKRPREEDDHDQLTNEPWQHINFFKEEEEGKKTSGTNADYEAEKKAEKEKEEKAIGLLTYLGQSAVEGQTEKPWYYKPPEKRQKAEEKSTVKHREEFDLKHKWNQDPMKQMARFLHQKEKITEREKAKSVPVRLQPTLAVANTSTNQTSGVQHRHQSCIQQTHCDNDKLRKSEEKHRKKESKKKKKKEKHKSKSEKKHKHKSKLKHKKHKKHKYDIVKAEETHVLNNALAPVTLSSGSKTIQQLRAERLKREREEKVRTEQLLAKVRGDTPQAPASQPVDDRDRHYNSQFNPELIRSKKKKNYFNCFE